MKIIQLSAENIKRLIAVEIRPDGHLVQITGKNGAGKQQPVSEPVLTPTGWKPIGNIKVGDTVIGSDGGRTLVLGVFPQEIRDTYLVTMADGAAVRCGPNHLWTVSRWANNSGPKPRITETLETIDILKQGLRRGTGRKWSVPVVEPVQFQDTGKELPIDPYTLGVILGDGHIEPRGYVTITSWDSEILDAVAPNDCWRDDTTVGSGFWSRPLVHLELAGKRSYEKFVPEQYLWASIEDRRQLLAGLLDTDGTAPDSWASFSSTSERLADAVVHLASSLGHVCKKSIGRTRKYRYNGELKEGRLAWEVSIKSHESPFTLERKSGVWSKSIQRGERFRFIDTIDRVDDEDSVCIKVAAEDGLYVTKDFILTHNTSVLDSIWWALSGAKHVQAHPIRRGANSAKIKLDMGEIIVTRTFKRDGNGGYTTKLDVVGNVKGTPQTMLDSLLDSLAFDPLAFARMDAKQQVSALQKYIPDVDFTALAAANSIDFANRAEKNRKAKEARIQADQFVITDKTPTERIDESALVQQLADAGTHNANVQMRGANRQQMTIDIAAKKSQAVDLRTKADELIQQAERLEAEAQASTDRLNAAPPLPDLIDVTTIQQQIAAARQINEQVAKRERKSKWEQEAITAESEAKQLTSRMEQRETQKRQAIATAKLPVDGISFTDEVIMLNGVPFDQASDAEQLRISCAIAMAGNPKLRVIRVRDGSLLDEESLGILAKMAEERDYQVWVERVEPGKVGFIIEDGMVKAEVMAEEK